MFLLLLSPSDNSAENVAETCVELEMACIIQNENGTYINCKDFQYEPPLYARNCVRHAILFGNITNIFNSTVVVSYHVDTGGETFNITEKGDIVELVGHGKEVILCDKEEGSEDDEVAIFDLFLHSAWKNESSSHPIECEAIHEKLFLTLPPAGAASELPSSISSVEPTSQPSIVLPTSQPSILPTSQPSILPVQCNLEAKLGYPYNDPDDAPYMGYSAEWLMVEIMDAEDEENSHCYSLVETEWCSYNNSGGYDSAYLGNVDDYYDDWAATDDLLFNETFTLTDIGGLTLNFTVSHHFWDEDYYHEYDCWSDHMLASVLTINNTVTGVPLNPEGGWSHPVDKKVKTHIEEKKGKYIINPEYQGDFYVLVKCTEDCACSAFNYTVL